MEGQLFYFQSEKLSQFWVVYSVFPRLFVMLHKIYSATVTVVVALLESAANLLCFAQKIALHPWTFTAIFIIDKERRNELPSGIEKVSADFLWLLKEKQGY